jgi:hypothetical protein
VERQQSRKFFSTLSQIKSSFIPLESASRAEHVHPNNDSNALLAGMLPLSEGDGGTPSSVLQEFDSPGKTSEPIGSLGSLASHQLATPSFRNVRAQDWEEWQKATRCPASPKKRKADQANIIRISEDGLVQVVEDTMTKILRDFVALTPAADSGKDVQALRNEVDANISKVRMKLTQLVNTMMERMQAEAERRAETMLQKLTQMLKIAPKTHIDRAAPVVDTEVVLGRWKRASGSQGQNQPIRAPQPSWATVTGTGAQKLTGWTTVTNGKKKTKKHPLDQRRILFVRNVQSYDRDPRDIMFEVNKALANARAHVTIRLIKMGYTEKGNLTGVMGENACAEDLFAHAQAVMAAVQKLDPEVVYMDKTEKWCKLRVHGVALDRYMTEDGLELARREIELMTGEQLPYAPRWIKGDTLGERYENGTIKRSTLVLTVKSKQAADTIMAKGLSFGGRRHEAERFWERGQGGMCMRCCGRDHFGKCVEEAKCFVCAGKHEGREHECTIESCSKRSEPCEHYAAKCANCRGPHQATSKRCPERRASRRSHVPERTEIRSSPPRTEMETEQDNLPDVEGRAGMETSQTELERTDPADAHVMSSDTDLNLSRNESLPRFTRELTSLTESFAGATQLINSSDPTPMSVDDDSASA